MKLLIVILLLANWAYGQELPDAPKPQPDGTVCIGVNSCGWHQVKELPPLPKQHNWFYRYPLLTGGIIGGGITLGWGLSHWHSCPSRIDGIPYDGTPPCPTECYSVGNCEWGTHQVAFRRKVFVK